MTEEEIIKLIKSKSHAINEDLLLSQELEEVKKTIEDFINVKLTDNNNLLCLRYRKFKLSSRSRVLWSNLDGFPSHGKEWIEPYISFFEKYVSQKK